MLRKSSASIWVKELWSRGMEAPIVRWRVQAWMGSKMNNEADEDE